MNKKVSISEQKPKEFIIVNDLAQVFFGLKGGIPQFTEDWGLAKSLNNEQQFKAVKRGTFFKLEMIYI